jgi:hypothetical protein
MKALSARPPGDPPLPPDVFAAMALLARLARTQDPLGRRELLRVLGVHNPGEESPCNPCRQWPCGPAAGRHCKRPLSLRPAAVMPTGYGYGLGPSFFGRNFRIHIRSVALAEGHA